MKRSLGEGSIDCGEYDPVYEKRKRRFLEMYEESKREDHKTKYYTLDERRCQPPHLPGHQIEENLEQIVQFNHALHAFDCQAAYSELRSLLEDRLFPEVLCYDGDSYHAVKYLTSTAVYGPKKRRKSTVIGEVWQRENTTPTMLKNMLGSIPLSRPSEELRTFGLLIKLMIDKGSTPGFGFVHRILREMCADNFVYDLVNLACHKGQSPSSDLMDGQWNATDWIKIIRELEGLFPTKKRNSVLELFVSEDVDLKKAAIIGCQEMGDKEQEYEQQRLENAVIPVALNRVLQGDLGRLVIAYEVMDLKRFINVFLTCRGEEVIEKFFEGLSPENTMCEEITYHVIKINRGCIEQYALKWMIALASRTREQMKVHKIKCAPWDESHKALDALIALMKDTDPQTLQKILTTPPRTQTPVREFQDHVREFQDHLREFRERRRRQIAERRKEEVSAESQMIIHLREALSSHLREIHCLCGDLVYNPRFEMFSNLYWRYKRNGVV